MGLVNDLIAPTSDEELTRRKALGSLSAAALGISGLGTMITTVRYLKPNVLFEPATRFKVGRPEEIAVGTLLVLPDQKLYILHAEEGFLALSAECTHLGCMTRYDPAAQRIICPCHGSIFGKRGTVQEGPAPKPLVRLSMELEQGHLVVDSRKPVDEHFVLKV